MSDDEPNAVSELNHILAKGLADTVTKVYHCDYCAETWDSGRKARQHAVREHDNLNGYRSERVE